MTTSKMPASSHSNRAGTDGIPYQYAGEAVSPRRAEIQPAPLFSGRQYWLTIRSEKAEMKMLRAMTATTEFSA